MCCPARGRGWRLHAAAVASPTISLLCLREHPRAAGWGCYAAAQRAEALQPWGTASPFGAATREAGGATSGGPPPTRGNGAAPSPLAAPIDARPITAENATGRPVLVASALWPQYLGTRAKNSAGPAGRRTCCNAPSTAQPIHDCHDARWPSIRRRARPARLTAAAAVATTRRKRHASEGGTRHNHHTGWSPS